MELHTNHVDYAARDDRPFATDDIGKIAGDDSAEEGTAGEDGHDERLVWTAESRSIVAGVGVGKRGVGLNGVNEVVVAINTVDVSRVVAEEDTSERRKGAHQVRLPSHGSFNAIDI